MKIKKKTQTILSLDKHDSVTIMIKGMKDVIDIDKDGIMLSSDGGEAYYKFTRTKDGEHILEEIELL